MYIIQIERDQLRDIDSRVCKCHQDRVIPICCLLLLEPHRRCDRERGVRAVFIFYKIARALQRAV